MTSKIQRVDGAIIYQGDIVLVPKGVQPALGIGKFLRWKDGIIPYYIQPNHPKTAEINQAINTVIRNTKLWFRPTTNFSSNFVTIINGNGCHSSIGKPIYGDSYPISIGTGCGGSVIIHELLHAAGLGHEQSRLDRDKYVVINWSNIEPSQKYNYEKSGWPAKTIGRYNFASIMHYDCKAFAINTQLFTMRSRSNAAFGQRTGLSRLDIDAENKHGHDVSPSRGKPPMVPERLPTLVYPYDCTEHVTVTEAMCQQWRQQVEELRQELGNEGLDTNERKAILQKIGALNSELRHPVCQP